MVANGVVFDDAVLAAVFHIDAFFVGVGDDIVGDLEGVGSAEADGLLVHVHADMVDLVVVDDNIMGVSVSMVNDDAA